MSLQERAINTVRWVARPAGIVGGITLALAASNVDTLNYPSQTPSHSRIDVSTLQNRNALAGSKVILVDNPQEGTYPDSMINEFLSRESKEITSGEFSLIYDVYFSRAMEKFKSSSPRRNALMDTDGTAIFNTEEGHRIILTRDRIRDNIILDDGKPMPVYFTSRKITIVNLNLISPAEEGPVHILSTAYDVTDERKPFQKLHTQMMNPEGNTVTIVLPETTMTQEDMFRVASKLKTDFDKSKNTSLPFSFQPIPRQNNL